MQLQPANNNMDAGTSNRIDAISRMIFEIASGNYDYPIESSDKDDYLDAIVAGISMLREELKASTVSRDYMDSIYKGVVDMLFVLDPTFNVQSINTAVTELLGFEDNSLVGKHFSALIDNDSLPELATIGTKLEKQNSLKNIELYFRKNNGMAIPTSCSFSFLYDTKKQATGILIIAKDTIFQKKAEAELRKAKETAEAANVAKSRFLANMSHEIRTPLNGILGITEVLLTDKNATNIKYLEIIKSSGQNLARLINDILDLSKIESGKLNLEKIPFNFAETMVSNLHSYRHLAEQKGLAFDINVDKSVPQTIVGDPTRISQILINLVGNSIKFTQQGSINISFSAVQKGEEIILEGKVRDSGIGIAKDKLDSIFQSFTQADDSVTRKYGGTGLGLTIVENIVKLMEGTVRVASPPEPGQMGSLFTFTLKLGSQGQQKLESKGGVDKPSFKKAWKILVVDDNKVNLIVAKKTLQGFGAQVTIAESGESAIALAKENKFDLVLMDIQMPEMDGYTTTRALRTLNFTNPILALSANVFNEHIQKSIDSGMNGHLEKPYTPKQLYELVAKHMESTPNLSKQQTTC
jgi:two-component system, sensor histidine kinase